MPSPLRRSSQRIETWRPPCHIFCNSFHTSLDQRVRVIPGDGVRLDWIGGRNPVGRLEWRTDNVQRGAFNTTLRFGVAYGCPRSRPDSLFVRIRSGEHHHALVNDVVVAFNEWLCFAGLIAAV